MLASPDPAVARRSRAERVQVKRDVVAGGTHWRIAVRGKGVLHVWRPPGFRRKGGGIVLYVHGYNLTADRAWNKHRLAEQFKKSRQNAIFIVVDGPSGAGERVKFDAAGRVLLLVMRYARLRLPHGHIVAMVHSGGFRTVAKWLDYRYLTHVILVDALYGHDRDFMHWITEARHHDWNRLLLVARDTLPQTRHFVRQLRRKRRARVVERDAIPATYGELSRQERRARILVLRSQHGHSALVSSGKVLRLLLRITRLRLL
jgi:hypothetical protein